MLPHPIPLLFPYITLWLLLPLWFPFPLAPFFPTPTPTIAFPPFPLLLHWVDIALPLDGTPYIVIALYLHLQLFTCRRFPLRPLTHTHTDTPGSLVFGTVPGFPLNNLPPYIIPHPTGLFTPSLPTHTTGCYPSPCPQTDMYLIPHFLPLHTFAPRCYWFHLPPLHGCCCSFPFYPLTPMPHLPSLGQVPYFTMPPPLPLTWVHCYVAVPVPIYTHLVLRLLPLLPPTYICSLPPFYFTTFGLVLLPPLVCSLTPPHHTPHIFYHGLLLVLVTGSPTAYLAFPYLPTFTFTTIYLDDMNIWFLRFCLLIHTRTVCLAIDYLYLTFGTTFYFISHCYHRVTVAPVYPHVPVPYHRLPPFTPLPTTTHLFPHTHHALLPNRYPHRFTHTVRFWTCLYLAFLFIFAFWGSSGWLCLYFTFYLVFVHFTLPFGWFLFPPFTLPLFTITTLLYLYFAFGPLPATTPPYITPTVLYALCAPHILRSWFFVPFDFVVGARCPWGSLHTHTSCVRCGYSPLPYPSFILFRWT